MTIKSIQEKTSALVQPLREQADNLTQGLSSRSTLQPPRWRWYHGIAFYVTAQALTFGLSGFVSSIAQDKREKRSFRETFLGDTSYFRELKQAKITPPSWVFAPAWTINNILTIYGNLRALNLPADTPGRDAYLRLQAATWLNYVIFNAAYFSLRSPLNAFLLTLSFFVLTVASVWVSIFRLKDTRIALSFATLLIWLIIALSAATAQALWNRDDLYKIGPFVQPDAPLVKQR